jgi:hypothetical protein
VQHKCLINLRMANVFPVLILANVIESSQQDDQQHPPGKRETALKIFGTYTSLREQNRSREDDDEALFDEDTTDLNTSDEEALLQWRDLKGAVRIDADNLEGGGENSKFSELAFLIILSMMLGLDALINGAVVGAADTPGRVWLKVGGALAVQTVVSFGLGVAIEIGKLRVRFL